MTTEEIKQPSPIELIEKLINAPVVRLPPERSLRSVELVEELKASAQTKRDRKNAKRLKDNS